MIRVSIPACQILAACLVALAPLAGCGGGETRAIADASHARLDDMEPEDRVVFACQMETVPETFPLESGERELTRGPNSVLVETTVSAFDRLAKAPGVDAIMVWGTPAQVGKMDPWIQAQVLNAWAQSEEITIACMAQFEQGTPDLRARLEAMAIQPGTVAGPVVTLDVGAPAVIELLQMPELVKVTQPKGLVPLKSKEG